MTVMASAMAPAARPQTPRRRVLILTPHFPPDSSAATHRMRLLAPYLAELGWEPIVLTADPAGYEQPIEPGLLALVPPDLHVERYHPWSPQWTRRIGIGDLGLRSMVPALRAAWRLLRRESIDALVITTYPVYTAALGPVLKRRFGVPFVVDLQDPWVGAWGRSVGGGPAGAPDLKSRASRWVAAVLERPVFAAADGIVGVSARTYEDVQARLPAARGARCAEIPLGGDERDFEAVRRWPTCGRPFDPQDGLVHLCAVGTLLPVGVEVARALFDALAELRRRSPDRAARLRLHFFGTSNQRSADAAPRVLPLAVDAGVADLVTETAGRIDYVNAVRVQADASALLLLGSTEAHYTASRLYPALLARRPIVAVYHAASTVSGILRGHTRPPTVRLVQLEAGHAPAEYRSAIASALDACAEGPQYRGSDVDSSVFEEYSARTMAGRLATLLSEVA